MIEINEYELTKVIEHALNNDSISCPTCVGVQHDIDIKVVTFD